MVDLDVISAPIAGEVPTLKHPSPSSRPAAQDNSVSLCPVISDFEFSVKRAAEPEVLTGLADGLYRKVPDIFRDLLADLKLDLIVDVSHLHDILFAPSMGP